MCLSRKEKMLLHVYKQAALLDDDGYRRMLRAGSGCRSAADADFNQEGFETTMARLEGLLFDRVKRGLCPDPIEEGNRWIRSEFYWRHKLPKNGRINSRQQHLIRELWQEILPLLPQENRNTAYFAAIVAKATGRRDIGESALSDGDAFNVIEALRDRLKYALAKKEVA